VTLVTPAPLVSDWTQFALEQVRIEKRLRSLGVQLLTRHELLRIEPHEIMTTDGITGAVDRTPADGVILVTDRVPNDGLYGELQPLLADGRLRSLRLIGDAEAPGLIAQAVFAGHLAAREFDESPADGTPFAVERVRL
jgi:dimethylamine/trimethylamine dehydrogenase